MSNFKNIIIKILIKMLKLKKKNLIKVMKRRKKLQASKILII